MTGWHVLLGVVAFGFVVYALHQDTKRAWLALQKRGSE